eukprot:PhF_6_TR1974/c0_g1_i1/m.3272/K03070/secA; preprotein translocase subunit SecA
MSHSKFSDNAKSTDLLTQTWKYQKFKGFTYNHGQRDLFDEILMKPPTVSVDPLHDIRRLAILERVMGQPSTTMYCENTNPTPPHCCCYAHIVEHHPVSDWDKCCAALDNELKLKISMPISKHDLSPKDVLTALKIEGGRTATSPEWKRAFSWLQTALPYVCDSKTASPPKMHKDVANEVLRAGSVFHQIEHFPLRPCQLAAILLNVYGVKTGTKLLNEMKTGEGKTYVCGVSAAVVAKMFSQGPAIILTTSVDRANDDKQSTSRFIEAYLHKESVCVSELNVENPGAGCVAYGKVSDLQRIVVDALREFRTKELNAFLKECSIFLDEADHVLIEQAESLLYIASPCPSYHALGGIFFHIQYRIDYTGDYGPNKIKTHSAVADNVGKLTEVVINHIRDEENKKGAFHPPIIDLEVCVATWVAGAMSARLKKCDKEFVLEVTTKEDSGTIPNTVKVTIVDMATGTESDGTRWTTEAPFIEAMHEIPMGGSEPLAFYCALPYVLDKVKWFGGLSGTLGPSHTLEYYATTYDVRTTFRISKNKPTTIYHLPTLVTNQEEDQIRKICESAETWLRGDHKLRAKGPILIISGSIEQARRIERALKKRGHAVTVKREDDLTYEDHRLEYTEPLHPQCAHVVPFYLRGHSVMEKLPDDMIVVATSKGGRGLDLKPDGKACPQVNGTKCPLTHCGSPHHDVEMGSVLFVILTEVLPGRQDEQARGRCGRSGKAGVVQYILYDKEFSDSLSPDAFRLKHKMRKDDIEINDLAAKSNRIGQHRFDGWVLEKFCENVPSFVDEWMKKLFPPHSHKDDREIQMLKPIVRSWLREYTIEMWAYWRGYGGARRKPGDFYDYFEHRMGLRRAMNLAKSEDPNALRRFADRFWCFANVMRLSGEALYSFAKTLLAANPHPLVFNLCRDILDQASAPSNTVWKLLPDGDSWRPEFSGNAALLFARLSKDPREGIERAKNAIRFLIVQHTSDDQLIKELCPATLQMRGSRGEKNYYLVQNEEIVKQLQFRLESLEDPKLLNHLHTALSNTSASQLAYCLGYGWCQTIFEWYVKDPFQEPSKKTKDWLAHMQHKADVLAARKNSNVGETVNGGGGENAKVETDEQKGMYTAQGKAMMSALDDMDKVTVTNTDGHVWSRSAPKDNVSKLAFIIPSLLRTLSFAWNWLMMKMTAPAKKVQRNLICWDW